MYARDISTKIKSSLHSKAKRGEYLGAFDPYGYIRDPVDPDVFSGLFRCEACGTAMRKHRTGNGKYVYYVCGRHHQQRKFACSSHYINCDVITRIVQEDIKNAVLFAGDTERAIKELTDRKCSEDEKNWRG